MMDDTTLPSARLKRTLIAGSLWALIGKLSGGVSALVVNALLARLLSPAELGSYFLLFSVVSAAALAAQCGLPSTIVRSLGEAAGTRERHRIRPVIAAASRYAAISAAIVCLLCWLAGAGGALAKLPRGHWIEELFLLATIWVVVLAWQDIVSAVFRGLQDIRNSVMFGGAAGGFLLSLLLTAVWLAQRHATLKDVVVCSLVSSGMGVACGILLVRLKMARLPVGRPVRQSELLKASLPMLVAVVFTAVKNRADLWLLGMYRTANDVALYGAASRLAATLPFFLMIANTALAPVIAELAAGGRCPELEKLVRNAATIAFLPCLLQLACFVMLGREVMGIFFGGYYRGGATVLAILAVGGGFSVWAGACGLTLIMTGNQATQMGITVFCTLFTVVASLLAVRDFGATGVALASSSGVVLQNILMLWFAKTRAGVWTHAGFSLPDFRLLSRGGDR